MTGSCCSIGITRTEIDDAPNCIASVTAVNTRPVRVAIEPAMTLSSVARVPGSTSSSSSSSNPTVVHAATIANVTSTTGSRQIGTVRRARRVRRHRIAVASALGTFSVTTPTAVGTDAGGGTGTGAGASGTPKRPAPASCTTIFHRINGSRYRCSRPIARASLRGRFLYRHRAHGDRGRASRAAPNHSRTGTNMPTSPVQTLPLIRVTIARSTLSTTTPAATSRATRPFSFRMSPTTSNAPNGCNPRRKSRPMAIATNTASIDVRPSSAQ